MTRWQLFGKFLTVPGIRNTLSAIRLISEFHWNCIYLLLVLDNERKGRRRRTKLWEVEEDRQIQLWKSLKYLRFWKWAKNSIVFRSHATDWLRMTDMPAQPFPLEDLHTALTYLSTRLREQHA